MTLIVDTAGRLDGAACHAAGVTVAVRYACHPNALTAGKIIKPAERVDLAAHGVPVVDDMEWFETRPEAGAPAGKADVEEWWALYGQYSSPGAWVVINSDYNAGAFGRAGRIGNQASLDNALAYHEAAHTALRAIDRRALNYSGSWFASALKDRLEARSVDPSTYAWWLAAAANWSYLDDGRTRWVPPWMHWVQELQQVSIAGVTCDISTERIALPGLSPTTTKDTDMYTLKAPDHPEVFVVGANGKRHIGGFEFEQAKRAGVPFFERHPDGTPITWDEVQSIPDVGQAGGCDLGPVLAAVNRPRTLS